MNQAKFSVILCVLNEKNNIRESLEHIRATQPDEFIVVDGGSKDGTTQVLREFGDVRTVEAPGIGLLGQRLMGIRLARNELVVLVNSEQFPGPTAFALAAEELAANSQLHGIQFGLSTPQKSFWSRSWSSYFAVTHPPGATVPLLGRPCVTYKSLFMDFEVAEQIFNEDTWVRYREKGLRRNYRVSLISVDQRCPDQFKAIVRQFWKYGESDFYSAGNWADRWSLLFHTAFRIGFSRSVSIARTAGLKFVLFTVLLSFVRTLAHIWKFAGARFRFSGPHP